MDVCRTSKGMVLATHIMGCLKASINNNTRMQATTWEEPPLISKKPNGLHKNRTLLTPPSQKETLHKPPLPSSKNSLTGAECSMCGLLWMKGCFARHVVYKKLLFRNGCCLKRGCYLIWVALYQDVGPYKRTAVCDGADP
eukprot:6467104-Amphidinium_carterae.1